MATQDRTALHDVETLRRVLGGRLNLLLHGPGTGGTDLARLAATMHVLPAEAPGRIELVRIAGDGLTLRGHGTTTGSMPSSSVTAVSPRPPGTVLGYGRRPEQPGARGPHRSAVDRDVRRGRPDPGQPRATISPSGSGTCGTARCAMSWTGTPTACGRCRSARRAAAGQWRRGRCDPAVADGRIAGGAPGSGAHPAGDARGGAAVAPDGRYRLHGNVDGAFWYVVGLRRFEVDELDEQLQGVTRLTGDTSF